MNTPTSIVRSPWRRLNPGPASEPVSRSSSPLPHANFSGTRSARGALCGMKRSDSDSCQLCGEHRVTAVLRPPSEAVGDWPWSARLSVHSSPVHHTHAHGDAPLVVTPFKVIDVAKGSDEVA